MTRKIGVIDEPISESSKDNLDLSIHANSLIKYIEETDTPITIGIQGEWGSGKTSLINSIKHVLSEKTIYRQIWINSWEYSLLSTPEESLMKIVSKIISELLGDDKEISMKDSLGGAAKAVFQGALRIGAGAVGGMQGAEVAKELLDTKAKGISDLRKELSKLVNEIKKSQNQPFEKIIIYVDDLDRIEPKNAVSILELLKNIFNVEHCVFILAIDYQVVVKGLEHKFGKQTAENEWEFRAFFDKIIQLPFMMPMGQYNIGKYVNKLLIDIGFVEGEGLDTSAIREIIVRTVGGNPRAIKRLVNSVSLIQIFSETKAEADEDEPDRDDIDKEVTEEQKKFLLFSLLCLQIAYPHIYTLLTEKPNFTQWDDSFANSETMKKEQNKDEYPQFEEEFNNAKETDDFNEVWEHTLYRICYVRPRLRARVIDISRFFSYIKDELLNGNEDLVGALVIDTLENTSVTSVTSTDKQQIVIPERTGAYKRRMLDSFDTYIEKEKIENGHRPGVVELMDLIEKIHIDVSVLPDVLWKYAGGVTGYINKHKFITLYNGGKKDGLQMRLLRHLDDDYKIPKLEHFETSSIREYQVGKPSTDFESYNYNIKLRTLEGYEKDKEIILSLIKKSIDMCVNHYSDKLSINSKKPQATCKGISIKQRGKVEEMALKYLNNEYTYDVK
ncbi:MAG: P-loop NTPase fold protein [Gammaproteobacteria bacterium]